MFTAAQAVAWVRSAAAVIEEHAAELTKLDSAIGDGDHGTNMNRGFKAAVQRLDGMEAEEFGGMFKAVGMALIGKVGRASGPLYGSLFLGMGKELGPALDEAAAAAEAGMKATIPMIARKGRASYLGERSRDHQDPGATSTWLLVRTLSDVVNGR